MNKCEFKRTLEADVVEYSPQDIQMFRFDEANLYASMNIQIDGENKTYFIEQLIEGIVDVFYFTYNNEGIFFVRDDEGNVERLENTRIEVRKGNQLYETRKKEYIAVLNKLFQDSPATIQKVKNIALTPNTLINLAQDYHNEVCSDYSCEVYAKKESKINLALGIYVGMSSSTFNPHSDYFTRFNNDFSSSTDPLIGFYVNISDPFLSEKLSFQLGANRQSAGYEYDTMDFKMTYVKIPFSLKYTLQQRGVKPFFQIGFAYNIWSKGVGNRIIPELFSGEAIQERRNQLGLFAAMGALFGISEKLNLSAQVRFERFGGMLHNTFSRPAPYNNVEYFDHLVKTKNNYLSFSLGLEF
ncbi:MAG: PorT family protein [Cyclobacteriaceae bacterium]